MFGTRDTDLRKADFHLVWNGLGATTAAQPGNATEIGPAEGGAAEVQKGRRRGGASSDRGRGSLLSLYLYSKELFIAQNRIKICLLACLRQLD